MVFIVIIMWRIKLGNLIKSLCVRLYKVYLRIKFKGLVLGVGVRIDLKTRINVGSNKLVIGNNVYLRSNSNGYHAGMPFGTSILIDGESAVCSIGDNSRINGCYIHAKRNILIGEKCVIAAGTNIIDSNGHVSNSLDRTIGRDNPEPIVIGNNVWIGLNVIVLKGTVIGDNSIIAAGSVVKGHFPCNVVLRGNPAIIVKEIKY